MSLWIDWVVLAVEILIGGFIVTIIAFMIFAVCKDMYEKYINRK